MDNPNLNAALRLADLGIAVFPCNQSKRPQPGVRWKEEASTDHRRIESWWRKWPGSLPAFELGRHGLVAMDCDRHGQSDGVTIFEALARENGDDPREWPTIETPSTGRHIFFRQDGSLTNARGALPAGIDVRGTGGYVIAEGAELPDGRSYHPLGYGLVITLQSDAVPHLPDWLATTLASRADDGGASPGPDATSRAPAAPAPHRPDSGARERAAFEAALADEVRKVSQAGEGQRNHTLNIAAFSLAQMVASGWGGQSEVDTALTEAALACGLRQPEIRKTIASGFASGSKKPRPALEDRDGYGDAGPEIEIRLTKVNGVSAPDDFGKTDGTSSEPLSSLASLPASELDGVEPPPREWHVSDLIPARTVTILTGDGATGKSLLALQLAVATAINSRWIGNEVRFGRCLFLTAEDEVDELHRRLFAIGKAEGFELSVLENLHISSLAGEDAVLAFPDRKTNMLTPTPLFGRLRATVDALRPSLIVLDTLADLFGGNEVDRAQARQFVGMLRGLAIDYDTTILLLAHPSLSGMSSGSGSSGSTAWNNSARSRLYLRRVLRMDGQTPVEDDPDIRELATVKANYGRSGGKTEIRWSEGRFIAGGSWDGEIHLGGLSPNRAEEVFQKLLRIYLVEGRNVSCNPSSTYAPRVFASDDRAERITAKAFQKAMNSLLEHGLIENVVFGPPSKGRFRLDFALPKD